ncbi:hypothetical protein OAT47_03545 [Gammaproteobacteria bacterium]|nr:hypothetical protein [Gammaproteobacteria bacterium]
MKKLSIFLVLIFISDVSANIENIINKGDNWVLESRSNRLSADSKVLYYMPSDAYHTYYAREFGDWNTFSIVDSRDIERLSKGDIIQIVESEYNEKVYKVKLLSGFNKGRIFYVITEDLLNYFKLSQEQIDE